MSSHHAGVRWRRTSADFVYDSYNRTHDVTFKQGTIVVPASSAPAFNGDADRVDPEEAFVAALSACHMLTFLALCARKRITVDAYADDAEGFLEKRPDGKLAMTRVILRPAIRFADGQAPDAAALSALHHRAHEECFIANSVTTAVTIGDAD